MSGLTDAERRGALVFALLVTLGTLHDLWSATHPSWTSEPPVEAVTAAPESPPPPKTPTPEPTVDLATADVAQLDALPGIGPVLAERIVAERRRVGGFRRVEDLLAVPGIGPRLFERLRPHLRVGALTQ
jgi:competence ComEA-like helix-hairpin-helix protein